jgi:uncharacterized membrane protein
VDNSDLHQTDNTQPSLLQHDSKMIAEENRMLYREEETFDQSPNNTDDEDEHFQQSAFEDIESRDGVTQESTASHSQIQGESTISKLEQEFINGMAKLKVDDVNKLPEKIQRTEELMKEYREYDREEDADKEMELLTQFKQLTLLGHTITKLKSTRSAEGSSSVMELYRLEQEFINEIAKLKVDDVNKLPEKIQQTEERMKDYRKYDREEDAEKEMQILTQLKDLTLLDDKIKKLKSDRSIECSSSVMKPCQFEQELVSGKRRKCRF